MQRRRLNVTRFSDFYRAPKAHGIGIVAHLDA